MFEQLRGWSANVWQHPSALRHLDFIAWHYLYLIGMVLIGSGLMSASGGIRYIDALFIASSSCTQAGLTTRNINTLTTWQQVVIYLLAHLTNPIVIHSATAFIRLHWFQRRFDHIVKETRMQLSMRRTRSRAVSIDHEERGVGGREIRVLFDRTIRPSFGPPPDSANDEGTMPDRSHRRRRSSIAERISLSNILPRKNSVAVEDAEEPIVTLGVRKSHEQRMEKLDSIKGSNSGSSRSSYPTHAKEPESEADADAEVADARTTNQDIRFADLPMPRTRTAMADENNDANGGDLRRSRTADPGRSSLTATILNFGQRTMTMDGPSTNRVVRRRAQSGTRLPRVSTLDQAVSSAFRRRRDSSPASTSRRSRQTMTLPYISFQPTIGRNSAFVELTSEQRRELGGIEYRATKTLCVVLVVFYVGFHLIGFICFIAFIYTAQQYIPVVQNDAVSRGWWSVFTSASAMNDLGLTLNPDSFVSFQNASFLLLVASALIVIGNTGFPCMLRFVIWVTYKIWPRDSPRREEFAFLLDHPRRCFTLLFPSKATWWLVSILVAFNGIDLLLFMVLDLNNPEITAIPVGYRLVDGLFQAFCTRTAGFNVVNISSLHAAVIVSYMIMMYVSVFPVAISIRRTNVYEERSLGIYSHEDDTADPSFIGTHVRRQLGFDLWYIFLALFIICIIENPKLGTTEEDGVSIFNILFEIISAYGTVGLSLGFPGVDYSLSGKLASLSKLVIIALQIRGRHRGLPLKLDRAILLPSEKLNAREDEDNQLRRGRTRSMSMGGDESGTVPAP
ncbi:cation transport protein-domain-containing protein [Protomyces lactucae-debilis]|uniref:Potassium transport protein n=1 Tax=Protomyces lactucae-debilis TaxID=2754530 RepID=A0A1Y2ETF5_PROLT|nr:cation transport protein-domain-containing protein [Protomyces lactucae-debilis]ORY74839.1 cation transport protein-domain-containing protein [Protomyces lactucae-debilis]